jgi:hypothetical protein
VVNGFVASSFFAFFKVFFAMCPPACGLPPSGLQTYADLSGVAPVEGRCASITTSADEAKQIEIRDGDVSLGMVRLSSLPSGLCPSRVRIGRDAGVSYQRSYKCSE